MGAFLLTTLLITSAITVAVLRRRKRRKGIVPVEGTEGPEVIGISLTPTTSKQQESIEASGEREDLHRRSADALGQSSSCPSMMTAVRSVGDYYDITDVPSQEGTGPQCNHTKDHRDDQAKGDPNAVYAVVDKSKKKKQQKTQGGASAEVATELNLGVSASQVDSGHDPSSIITICTYTGHECATILDCLGHTSQGLYTVVGSMFSRLP